MCGACFTPLLMLRLVHFAADTQLAGDMMGTLRGGVGPSSPAAPGTTAPMGRHATARQATQGPRPSQAQTALARPTAPGHRRAGTDGRRRHRSPVPALGPAGGGCPAAGSRRRSGRDRCASCSAEAPAAARSRGRCRATRSAAAGQRLRRLDRTRDQSAGDRDHRRSRTRPTTRSADLSRRPSDADPSRPARSEPPAPTTDGGDRRPPRHRPQTRERRRRTSFGRRDRGGLLLGFRAPQLVLLGLGVRPRSWSGSSWPVADGGLIGAGRLCGGGASSRCIRSRAGALVDWVRPLANYAYQRVTGTRPLPRRAAGAAPVRGTSRGSTCPGWASGCGSTRSHTPHGPVALLRLRDRWTVVLQVRGSNYVLADRASQERRIAAWGALLVPVRAGGLPRRRRCSGSSGPSPTAGTTCRSGGSEHGDPTAPYAAAYAAADRAAPDPTATRHETLPRGQHRRPPAAPARSGRPAAAPRAPPRCCCAELAWIRQALARADIEVIGDVGPGRPGPAGPHPVRPGRRHRRIDDAASATRRRPPPIAAGPMAARAAVGPTTGPTAACTPSTGSPSGPRCRSRRPGATRCSPSAGSAARSRSPREPIPPSRSMRELRSQRVAKRADEAQRRRLGQIETAQDDEEYARPRTPGTRTGPRPHRVPLHRLDHRHRDDHRASSTPPARWSSRPRCAARWWSAGSTARSTRPSSSPRSRSPRESAMNRADGVATSCSSPPRRTAWAGPCCALRAPGAPGHHPQPAGALPVRGRLRARVPTACTSAARPARTPRFVFDPWQHYAGRRRHQPQHAARRRHRPRQERPGQVAGAADDRLRGPRLRARRPQGRMGRGRPRPRRRTDRARPRPARADQPARPRPAARRHAPTTDWPREVEARRHNLLAALAETALDRKLHAGRAQRPARWPRPGSSAPSATAPTHRCCPTSSPH